jgi:hypothetical protein
MASILVHGAVVSLLFYGLIHTPQISDPARPERYTMRRIELHAKEPAVPPSRANPGRRQSAQSRAAALQPDSQLAERPSASWQIPQFAAAPQTLVQPDLPPNLALAKETPIPTVVIWTPNHDPVKTIVPPLPQKAAGADVKPSLDAPNDELNLADLSVASASLAEALLSLVPSTTSPVSIQEPDSLQMAPAMTSESSAQPTPAAAMSLSDLHMPQGTVTLPPANETAPNTSPTTPAPGRPVDSSQTGVEYHNSRSGDVAAAESAGDQLAVAVNPAGADVPSESHSKTTPEAGRRDRFAVNHITLPKSGQFGVVVLGSSLDEQYPELLQIWGDRIAYTVYLQIGQSRNWTLQYSLPRGAETAMEASVTPLEALWPYEIVRPHVIPALLDADAMVLHGLVNRAGRFESLAIVYLARPPQGTLVLNSLAQWQFRPAAQNGIATAVEVVLVIPNESE